MQRKGWAGAFSATLKKYFPAVTPILIYEMLHPCGTFFEKLSIVDQMLKRTPEP